MGTADQPAWVGNTDLPPERRGLMVLGTPLGHTAYVARRMEEISAEHEWLLQALRGLPELQSSWLLLACCASTRANYYLWALPPSQSAPFAARHNGALSRTLSALLDDPVAPEHELSRATSVSRLPLRFGGLGLRCATRLAPAAYWASWCDCLPMIQQRHPALAAFFVESLSLPAEEEATADCLQEARAARTALLGDGYEDCPTWPQVLQGARPRQPAAAEAAEPGDWAHGWQFWAAQARDARAKATLVEEHVDPAWRALLRSQCGRGAGRVFTVLPTTPSTTLSSAEFRVLLLRRLRLPLPLAARCCSCRRALDARGDHRAECSTCGVLRKRGKPLEKALARVCREAGARVAENVLLRDMNLQGISSLDGRQIEVVANGLPLWGGAQLAVDATLVSPVRRDGRPQPHAAEADGTQLQEARRRKERKYWELLRSRRCRLVVLGLEVGGRWSDEALDFIRRLARAKAREHPPLLRASAQMAYSHRWTGLLAVAAQRALATTLLELPVDEVGADGELPLLEDVLHEGRLLEAPTPSRLSVA